MRFSRGFLPGLLVGLLLAASGPAWAEDAPQTLRGTITAVAGEVLTLKTSRGTELAVTLADDTAIRAITLSDVSEIQPGRYVGTTAMPQADGTLKALEVHVFPPEMAGTGDGHRPWDLAPGSTMTNGAVGAVTTTKGRTITIEYQGGQQIVVVPDDVPVVDIEPGDPSLLLPGTQVVLFAKAAPDGTLTALFISAGKDGVKPPM